MSNVDDVLHLLIDLGSGAKASLSPAEADAAHRQVTPGYGDKPVSDDEAAAAQAVLDRRAAEKPAPAAAAAVDSDV